MMCAGLSDGNGRRARIASIANRALDLSLSLSLSVCVHKGPKATGMEMNGRTNVEPQEHLIGWPK